MSELKRHGIMELAGLGLQLESGAKEQRWIWMDLGDQIWGTNFETTMLGACLS